MLRLKSLFEAHSDIDVVILYGSRAKGTHRPGSDIDLALKSKSFDIQALSDLSGKIDDMLLPYEIDLCIFQHIDNRELVDHINRIGKVIFNHE